MDDKNLHFIFLSILFVPSFFCREIGDACPGGKPGTCVPVQDCASALKNIKLRKTPQLCFFEGQMPIICCSDMEPKSKTMTITRRSGRMPDITSTSSTNTAADPNLFFKRGENLEECSPLSFNLTPPKTGQKALENCLKYREQYLYPCVESPVPGQDKMRADFCAWSSESLIINGKNASRGEFPHMALLGFGTVDIEWKCGGVIVSPRFVLTVAHCTTSPHGGPVTKIKINILRRSEPDSMNNVYDVLKIHVHPRYHSPQKYNDIALLETDREMQFNPFVLPACLHDGTPVNDTEAIVTGWGHIKINKFSPADNLQKAFLSKFEDFECVDHHQRFRNRNLKYGIDTRTQICFGDKINRTDTCGGDSGGPVQIRHPTVYCMYLIIGLTSYGRSCGRIAEPGVYTRVSYFLPWIESIVWP